MRQCLKLTNMQTGFRFHIMVECKFVFTTSSGFSNVIRKYFTFIIYECCKWLIMTHDSKWVLSQNLVISAGFWRMQMNSQMSSLIQFVEQKWFLTEKILSLIRLFIHWRCRMALEFTACMVNMSDCHFWSPLSCHFSNIFICSCVVFICELWYVLLTV